MPIQVCMCAWMRSSVTAGSNGLGMAMVGTAAGGEQSYFSQVATFVWQYPLLCHSDFAMNFEMYRVHVSLQLGIINTGQVIAEKSKTAQIHAGFYTRVMSKFVFG